MADAVAVVVKVVIEVATVTAEVTAGGVGGDHRNGGEGRDGPLPLPRIQGLYYRQLFE